MHPKNPPQITDRLDPAMDWEEVAATAWHLLWPPRALGRPLCAVWELSKHTPAKDDGERASGERTVVEMATALKGGCRGVGNRGPRI